MTTPAMPDPKRTVRRSVSICMDKGMTKAVALNVIVQICASILEDMPTVLPFESNWVTRVAQAALSQLKGEAAANDILGIGQDT